MVKWQKSLILTVMTGTRSECDLKKTTLGRSYNIQIQEYGNRAKSKLYVSLMF